MTVYGFDENFLSNTGPRQHRLVLDAPIDVAMSDVGDYILVADFHSRTGALALISMERSSIH